MNDITPTRPDSTPDAAARGGGNPVRLLRNGDEIFPAMLEAVRGAQHSICFETYVYWQGAISREFAEALAGRAAAGVEVRVLLDWYGSLRMEEELVALMTAAGVEVELFRPLRFYHLRRFNNRTHRKILVVDGEVAFTGGVGIADEWTGDAQDADHWRDNHYRFTGPAVAAIQRAFDLNWPHTDQTAARRQPGGAGIEIVTASPARGGEAIHRLFLESIAGATREIHLATAYFMPGERLIDALLAARARGVAVTVLVCGPKIDFKVVRRASRHHWGRLLGAGVRLFEYQPTLFHVKCLVIDGKRTVLGSANFDSRSCMLNEELNAIVHSPAFARENLDAFDADLQRSSEVTLSTWRARPWKQKVTDALAQVFRSQL